MKIIIKNPNPSRDIRVGMSKLSTATVDILNSIGAVYDDESELSFCLAAYKESELVDTVEQSAVIQLGGEWLLEVDGSLYPRVFTLSQLQSQLSSLGINMSMSAVQDSELFDVYLTATIVRGQRIRFVKTASSQVNVVTSDASISVKDGYVDFYVRSLPEDTEDEIDDALFTKVTYIQTDDSEPMTVVVQYKPENVNGKLHIDWGDGTKEVFTKESFIVAEGQENVIVAAHPYTTNGEYVVKVYSTTNTFIVFPTITKLIDWGTAGNMQIKLSSANLIEVPTTLPSHITDTSNMFQGAVNFNQDISMWDTSNVTNMSYMFINATSFNQPIGSWNVSNVTDMSSMFYGASLFNQPLNDWDTSNVTDMSFMFQYAALFNQPLSNWNVSKVTDMLQMFLNATEFNQDLSRWCVALIISSPTSFKTGSALAMENYPVWGTCPTAT